MDRNETKQALYICSHLESGLTRCIDCPCSFSHECRTLMEISALETIEQLEAEIAALKASGT